jgi:hypothetical protein
MQKGAQLEYKEYYSPFYSKIPISRVLLHVDQVTDSAGSTWSTITKRVFSVIDSNDHYERKVVLQCDGRNLLFPYDFYFTDTIYRRDFYPKVITNEYSYAAVYIPLKDAITYIVPLVADCIVSLPEGKKQIERFRDKGYSNVSQCGGIFGYRAEDLVKINCIKLAGREMFTTPAGNFDCYKLCMEQTIDNSGPIEFTLYYNKEAGFVKLEDSRRSVELVSIRK